MKSNGVDMSGIRKILCSFLSVVLAFSLSFPSVALAADGSGGYAAGSVTPGQLSGQDAPKADAEPEAGEGLPFSYVYLGAKEVPQGQMQDVAVALADEAAEVGSARLVLRHGATEVRKAFAADQVAGAVMAFSFNARELSLGQWVVESVEYAVGGRGVSQQIAESYGAAFQVTEPQDSQDGLNTSFYAVEDEQLIETASLEEAVATVQDAEPLASATFAASRAAAKPSSNIVVGLDPGHGGADGGASTTDGKVHEADLTWKIANYCKDELLHYAGISKVVFSRTKDEYTNDNNGGLQLRVNRLKAAGANIIVSLHLNASGVGGTGAEVYAPNSKGNATVHAQGVELAQKIAAQLGDLGITLRSGGVKERNSDDGTDYYGIIRYAKSAGIPGVIVEHCFIDSTDYKNYLNSEAKLKNLGVADAKGIAKYYGLNRWSWTPQVTVGTPNNGKVRITVSGAGAPANLKKVQIPVWGEKGGQNDIKWYDATKLSNGNYTTVVSLTNHNESGIYDAHVYATVGSAGAVQVAATTFNITGPTATLDAPVVNADKGTLTYTAHVTAPYGATAVQLRAWCAAGGKDDLKTYNMKRTAGTNKQGTYTVTVKMSSHKNQVGTYNAQLYVTDANKLKAPVKSRAKKMSLPKLKLAATAVSGGKYYRITASGGALAKATQVQFPVWSSTKGQDDIRWYKAKKNSSGQWYATVAVKNHKTAGTYQVHCYGTISGKLKQAGQTTFKVTGPSSSFTSVKVNKDKGTVTFTAHVKAPLGISKVQLPVWCSSVGGQDDIKWYKMKRTKGTSKDGYYSVTVKMSSHKYQAGTYTAHLYATDSTGIQGKVKVKKQKMSLPSFKISAQKLSNGTQYRLTATGGLASKATAVRFPVWSNTNGQDDIKWYKAKKSGGKWVATVSLRNHKSSGTFTAHCYATVGKRESRAGATTFQVDGPVVTLGTPRLNNAQGTVTFTAHVKSPRALSSVKLQAWCSSIGGKDDLRTYTMKRTAGNAREADYSCTVKLSNHKYQTGTYKGYVYAKDSVGLQPAAKGKSATVSLPVATVTATAVNGGKSYLVTATGGVLAKATAVSFPVWSEANGQDDIVWYKAKKVNGKWQATVPLTSHKTAGPYAAHCYATVGGNMAFAGGASFSVSQAVIDSLGYPIMGTSSYTQAQMVARFKKSGCTYPASTYKNKGAATIEAFVKVLCEQAAKEGVRAEVVFAQAMHETGWLQFKGDVKASQCNFAGIGATGGVPGNSFKNVAEGLLAQVQHLKAYASTAPLNEACVDPRFTYVVRGCAPTVEALGEKWAVGGTYGDAIVKLIREL